MTKMNEYNVKDYTNKILLQMKGKSVKDTVTTGIVEREKKTIMITMVFSLNILIYYVCINIYFAALLMAFFT